MPSAAPELALRKTRESCSKPPPHERSAMRSSTSVCVDPSEVRSVNRVLTCGRNSAADTDVQSNRAAGAVAYSTASANGDRAPVPAPTSAPAHTLRKSARETFTSGPPYLGETRMILGEPPA